MARRSWSRSAAVGRVRAAERLQRLLLGSRVGHWPQWYADSLLEHSLHGDVAAHLVQVHVSSEPVVVHYPFPEAYPPAYSRQKAFDAVHVYRVSDVLGDPASGLVWLPEGIVLGESYGSLRKSLSWDDVRHVRLAKRGTQVVQQSAIIVAVTGYFHFLLEVLPALLRSLAIAPDAAVVVRQGPLPPYMEQTFRLLDLHDRIVPLAQPTRFADLVFSAIPRYSGFVHPDSVALLKRALGLDVDDAASGPPLYLSRQGAAARSVPNEAVLQLAVAREGFEIVHPSDLDLAEQIRLLSTAEAVVGLHGAALANLVWSRRGTPVLEVHPRPEFNDCYGRLALTCELNYRGLLVPRNPGGPLANADIDRIVAAASEMRSANHA